MFKQPFLGKYARVGEIVDGEFADVVDGFVKLSNLSSSERVAVLFWVNLRIVEYLVADDYMLDRLNSEEEQRTKSYPTQFPMPLIFAWSSRRALMGIRLLCNFSVNHSSVMIPSS